MIFKSIKFKFTLYIYIMITQNIKHENNNIFELQVYNLS
jgi:hypothetical protein